MSKEYTFICPCLFGVEGILKREIADLGLTVTASDGRVKFTGSFEDGARVNVWSRCAERVLLKIGEFHATTFDELFEKTKALPFEDFIPENGSFPVKGYSLNSKLFSVSDCQAIIKKAAVERLKSTYKTPWFKEDGQKYQISFSIMKDLVTISIDMTGEALHKRGYRALSNVAPLRETLAAAMVYLSRPRIDIPFLDPMCGSGTIAIEAAMLLSKRPPGLFRTFAAASWDNFNKRAFFDIKEEAKDGIATEDFKIHALDIDEKAVELTKNNAKLAGVEKIIRARQGDVGNLKTAVKNGTIVTNPPYGERLYDKEEAREIYKKMGKAFFNLPGWRYYVISSDEEFENFFGKKADKKRKLYNGMIKCDLYEYLTPRLRSEG